MAGVPGTSVGAHFQVAVVDKQPLFRRGVIQTIHELGWTVREGSTAADALLLPQQAPLHMIIADAFNIAGGGADFLAEFTRRWPATKLVIVSNADDDEAVSCALHNGAKGFILKDVPCSELRSALSLVMRGEVYVTPTLGARILSRAWMPARKVVSTRVVQSSDDLTKRELQILSHVSLGSTNREIASALEITEKTVKHYMTSIMHKLGVRNRVEAVVAMRNKPARAATKHTP